MEMHSAGNDRRCPAAIATRPRRTAPVVAIVLGTLAAAALAMVAIPAAGGGQAAFVKPFTRSPATVWAVGDGADGSALEIEVAKQIESGEPDRFLYLGDVYDYGTAEDFAEGYRPVYGRFDAIAAPTPGNHEWGSRREGYYPYWARAKSARVRAWYAFRVGGWQVLSLNSETALGRGSRQGRWLHRRLRQTPGYGNCRIAFWHRPRYSAGEYGDDPDVEPLWRQLTGEARIVLNGHEHDMQRHTPVRGITEFVVGSGGHSFRDVDESDPRLGFAADDTPGALRLTLRGEEASAAFVDQEGRVLDSDLVTCERR